MSARARHIRVLTYVDAERLLSLTGTHALNHPALSLAALSSSEHQPIAPPLTHEGGRLRDIALPPVGGWPCVRAFPLSAPGGMG